jgi:mannonate dehydratase
MILYPLKGELSLSRWDAGYNKDQLEDIFKAYSNLEDEKLRSYLEFFLKRLFLLQKSILLK